MCFAEFEVSSLLNVSVDCIFLLLADNAAPAEGAGSPFSYMPVLIISGLAFYLIMIRPERKREKSMQEKLGALKKNDRVVTASGIYGTVINVKREADEVTLKVDEDTNTKLRVTLRSIAQLIEPGAEESKT
jgi:preprotein translocase subunit YajC